MIAKLFVLLMSMFGVPHATYRHVHGVVLPDPKVTPGSVRTTSVEELCAPGFTTRRYRHTTHGMKLTAYARYGQTPDGGLCKDGCEIDHLIPLTIGGSDDLANLWPQPAEPKPGFHEKDRLENLLHRLICRGVMTAKEAQRCIAEDWRACAEKVRAP